MRLLLQKYISVLEDFFRLIRFWNLIIIAFTQIFTAYFIVVPELSIVALFIQTNLIYLLWSTILIAAGGYVINDYYDVKIDIINKPDRLIIGRTFSRRMGMFIHLSLTSAGLACSLAISAEIFVFNAIISFLLWWYSNLLKRLPLAGNITISLLTGLSVYIVVLVFQEKYHLVFMYSVFAFFITLIREIIKDMEDMKGDRNFGCLTLPIKYGIRTTKRIIFLIEGLFVLLLLIIGAEKGTDLLLFFLLLVIIPLIVFTKFLIPADTKRDYAFLSKFCKLIMIGGVFSMIFA